MLIALVVEPVLRPPRIAVFAFLTLFGKPVRPLVTRNFTKHGAARLQMFVQWRTADPTGRRSLAIGEMIGVEKAERFTDTLLQIGPISLEWLHPADIDVPQIKRRLPIVNPLRQRKTGAAGGHNAN